VETHGDKLTQDPKITAQLLAALAALEPLRARIQAAIVPPPVPGSPAAIAAGTSLGELAFIFAGTNMAVAADHLEAWAGLMRNGIQPAYSHITLLRGALEGSVAARWLLDPRIDTAERLRRGIVIQLADYIERRKFEELAGATDKEGVGRARSAAYRIGELREGAKNAGVTDLVMPSTTWLFERYGASGYRDGRPWYGLVSAYAHGKQWALLTAKRTELVGTEQNPVGPRRGQVTANDQLSLDMTRLTLVYVKAALNDLERYVGRVA
jgi:hypothetical protein